MAVVPSSLPGHAQSTVPPDEPALCQLLDQLIVEPGVAPGGTAAVAARGPKGWQMALGSAGVLSGSLPPSALSSVNSNTLYDLASITKSVVALVCARLTRAGLPLDTPLGELLPQALDTPSEHTTLEALLSHRAGLVSHLEFFAPLRQQQPFDASSALRAAASARRPDCVGTVPARGFPPLYSDLGYLLVGAALRNFTQSNLDEVIDREINVPCGTRLLSARLWKSRTDFPAQVAPTEVVPWRGGELRGVVHDENAWALEGEGCAGNAGLFATAHDVARLGTMVLDALADTVPEFLTRKEMAVLLQPRPLGTLLAGFDGKSQAGSSAGQWFGPKSFGHLGFTGTSLWCDPASDIVACVLTNRVNPSRANILHQRYRPLLSDALFMQAKGLQNSP